MTWIRRRLEGIVATTEVMVHALDDPDVLFYVMFVMMVVAWTMVFLLLAGVI